MRIKRSVNDEWTSSTTFSMTCEWRKMSRSNRASSQSDPDSETRKKSVQVVADDDEDDQNEDDDDCHAARTKEGSIHEKGDASRRDCVVASYAAE